MIKSLSIVFYALFSLILVSASLAADVPSGNDRQTATDQNLILGRGFVPPTGDLPVYEAAYPASGMPPASLPTRYDCRELGVVSPVKNQSICGACYAFAAVGNAESKLLTDGAPLYNFSENSAKECSYGAPSCGGGNYYDVTNLFATRGIVLETCDPYVANYDDCDTTCSSIVTMLGFGVISTNAIPANDLLKSYIYTYGPVYSTFYAGNGDAWYFELNGYDGSYTLYNPTALPSNHAILIVGWDDTLSHAGGSGAWIIKNSWSSSWGGTCGYGAEEGYMTLAYGSANIGTWSSYMTEWQNYDSNGMLLYYNEAGWTGQLGYGSPTAWGLAAFTPDEAVDINRIEFWTSDVTTDIDVYIYDDFNGSSLSNLLVSKLNSSFPDPGYHSIELDSPLSIDASDDFYVALRVTNESYGLPIAYDTDGPHETGKTYYSSSGGAGTWVDAGLASTPKDLTIRARGTVQSVATCSFTAIAPTSGSDWPFDADRTITWTSANAGVNVKIDLFKGASLQGAISASTANDNSHSWQVDDFGGGTASDYRIRVADAADTSCNALSDYFTISLPCSLEVTNPTAASEWYKDSTLTITWNSSDAGANCRIFLYKDVDSIRTIAATTANDGSFDWTVNDFGFGGDTDYSIKILDAVDGNCIDFSPTFTIVDPCSLQVSSPTSGSEWLLDSTLTIEWTSQFAGSQVRILLYQDSDSLCAITPLTSNDGSFDWTVDDCGNGSATDYRIKIVSASDGTCFDFSDFFTITVPCQMQVSQPTTGSDWNVGESGSIQWNSSGAGANVMLELYQDVSLILEIDSSTANDGSYSWTVDEDGNGAGSDYRIKVTNTADTSCNDFSAPFTISIPCELELSEPHGGQICYLDSIENIVWSSSGAGSSVKLQLYHVDDLICDIDTLTDNDGGYSWTVNYCGEGPAADYRIKISDADDSTCFDFGDFFTITWPCEVEVTSPIGIDNWVQGDSHQLTWISSGGGANVRIDLYKNSTFQCCIDSLTANDGSFDWQVADCGGGTGSQYRIKVTDLGNPLCSGFSSYFTVTVLSVDTDAEELMPPDQLSLRQNYPNPFNPETTIPFDLPTAGPVELTVFNLLGQPVITLVKEPRAAGTHFSTWNGNDMYGNRVPSGIYFYRLDAGDRSLIRKMLLLK